MDKNGKIAGKISIIDLIVILIIAAVAVGTIYRFAAPSASVDAGDVTIRYTIRIDEVRDFTLPYYQKGLHAFERSTNLPLGVIIDFNYEYRYGLYTLLDGTIVRARQPNVLVIYVHLEARGRVTDGAIYVGGTRELNVGGHLYVRTRYVDVLSTVHSIEIMQ